MERLIMRLFAVGGVVGSVEGELAQLRDSHP
jgi:hypothetical protein